MLKKIIIKYAFIHAVSAIAYIALVAAFMSNAEKFFGPQNNKILGTTIFLTTFVISAAIMGILVFGKPVLFYLDGLKKEAISLAIYTVGFLISIAVIIVLVLLVF